MRLLKKLSILFIVLAIIAPMSAQAITPVSFPLFHVTDPATGMPLVGGLVWSYQAGTTTQSVTYSNAGLSQGNTFPIVLDSNGDCTIYINQPTKLVVEGPPPVGQTHGTVLWTMDNLEAAPYNSYVTVGNTVPPTPGTGKLSLYCSGTTLYVIDSTGAITSPATAQAIQQQTYSAAAGGGTGDAITANFTPALTAFVDKIRVWVWAPAANTTTTPTFAPNGLSAKTIVKGSNTALVAGDIPGANAVMLLEYNATLGKWVLVNPTYPAGVFPTTPTRVSVTTITAAATTTITGLSPGVRYKLYLNLVQNSSAGIQYVQFNADTGANYNYGNLNIGGSSSSSTTATSFPLTAGVTTIDAASGSIYECSFQTMSGNDDNVLFTANGGIFLHSSAASGYALGGQYSGAAALTSITIGTTAGTVSGTATLYQIP